MSHPLVRDRAILKPGATANRPLPSMVLKSRKDVKKGRNDGRIAKEKNFIFINE